VRWNGRKDPALPLEYGVSKGKLRVPGQKYFRQLEKRKNGS
jgi:hypothetical protein